MEGQRPERSEARSSPVPLCGSPQNQAGKKPGEQDNQGEQYAATPRSMLAVNPGKQAKTRF